MTSIPLQKQQKASSSGTLAAKCLLKMDIITNLNIGWMNSEKHCFKAFFSSFCYLCFSQLGQKTSCICPPSSVFTVYSRLLRYGVLSFLVSWPNRELNLAVFQLTWHI